MSILCTDLI